MRYVATIITLIVVASCDTARNIENPDLQSFTRLIGREGDQTGRDIVVVADGTMILLGNSRAPNEEQQLSLVKTTAEGYVLWERSIGDLNDNMDEEAKDLEALADSVTIAILSMQVNSANRDYIVRLMTLDGTITNSVTGGVLGHTEEAFTISETSDSFIVSGYTTNVDPNTLPNPADGFFARYNKNLSPYDPNLWRPTAGFGGDFDVAVRTIESGTDFFVFGYSNRPEPHVGDGVADYNFIVWVLGSSGIPRNQFVIGNSEIAGSSPSANESVTSVAVVPPQSGSGYILSGYSVDASTQKIFNMKIRGDLGSIDDTVIDPGTGLPVNNSSAILATNARTDEDAASSTTSIVHGSVFPSKAEGFFVLGSKGTIGNEEIYLKRLNNGLNDFWTSPRFFTFGGVGNDLPGAVAETGDGRIVVLGTMLLGESETAGQKKMVLMKLSPDGKFGQ